MGHLDFGTMQRLNIEAARKHAGQSDLVTPGGPPTGGGGGGNGGGTPTSLNTPDILNSLLNIPFFEIPSTSSLATNQGASSTFSSCSESVAGTPEEHEKKVFATLETPLSSATSSSSTIVTNTYGVAGGSSSASCSTSTVTSISIAPPSSQPPSSVELMRSKLIKEGLKHSIQSKRKSSGMGELDVRAELVVKQRRREELTPEDEERRKRRRERNKIAATKCRNKKKEKTLLLIQVMNEESESLEGNNIRLKSEISQLKTEEQQLLDALKDHVPLCSRVLGNASNLNESRGGTSGGGGNGGGGGGNGSRSLTSSHSMITSQFSTTSHHQGCYSSSGQTPHYSQFQGSSSGLPHHPHHHHHSYYSNNTTSIQLS